MVRGYLPELPAFIAVAEEGSFTRAAARLGMSQSALTGAIKKLEASVGMRLLARTTRSVSTTEAGQRLLEAAGPALRRIDTEVESLGSLRYGLSGAIRITSIRHAAVTILMPVLSSFMLEHPGVTIETDINDAFTDIVAKRFDAGIRFGLHVEKDMIGVPIGNDIRPAVVASPAYFGRISEPESPRDLGRHNCIGYRLAGGGHLYRWQFADQGRPMDVTVAGSMTVNDPDILAQAALDGIGLAYTFEHLVAEYIRSGELIRVLEPWCAAAPGYSLYYPSREKSPVLTALVDALVTARTRL